MFWKVLSKTFEEKGWDRECWEWRLFKELSIRGHDRLKNRHDSVAEDEAESHIAYLPVCCSRFQLWVRSRMELLPWVWAQVWTSWSLNMTQSDVSRSSASDRYFFHLSITAKKKKEEAKWLWNVEGRQVRDDMRQPPQLNLVRRGTEIFLTCQPSWRAELRCCSVSQSLLLDPCLIWPTWKQENWVLQSVFDIYFIEPAVTPTLYRPIHLSSGKGESSLLTKTEVFVLRYVKTSQLEK